ncbi:MAG: hypothetical protein RLO12_10630, partial [Fulvivirga sp.]
VATHVPLSAVFDPAIWTAGVLVGIALRGPSTYLTFRAIRMVGSENYLMGVAVMPAITLFCESHFISFARLCFRQRQFSEWFFCRSCQ